MITQRLILDGGYPDGIWTCPGCHSPLTSGMIQHPSDCPELRSGGDAGPLPSVAQLRVWLEAHGWMEQPPGPSGAFWYPPGGGRDEAVVVPAGDWAHAVAATLERIPKRSGLPFGEVLTAMRAIEVGDCGHA